MIELDLAIAVGFQVDSIRANRDSTLPRQQTLLWTMQCSS